MLPDEHATGNCPACGAPQLLASPRCGRCGALTGGYEVTEPTDRNGATRVRSALTDAPPVTEWAYPAAQAYEAPAAPIGYPVAPVAPYGPGTWYAAPPRVATPPEIWLVGIGLLAIAGILLDPVLRYGGPLVAHMLDGNRFLRALDDLFLEVFVLVGAVAVMFALLGIFLIRGSRVAQLLTCLLCGVVALAAVIEAGQAGSDGSQSSVPVVVILICAAVVALVTVTPNVRRFFGQDTGRPFGVLIAAAAGTWFGAAAMLCGVMFCLAGAVGTKVVAWGIAYLVVGLLLIALNVPLRNGVPAARAAAAVAFLGYVVLGFVVQVGSHAPAATSSTLIPLGVAIAAVAAMFLPASSNAHFGDASARTPRTPAGRVGLGTAVVAAVGATIVGFVASGAHGLSAADSYPTEVPAPTYYATTSPPEQSIQAGGYARSWTITETGAGAAQQAVLQVGDPQHYQPGVQNAGYAAGTACTLDPSSDAVVPARLTITNTGSSEEMLRVTLSGVGSSSIPGISGPVLEFEGAFTQGGGTCNDGSTFGLRSLDPIAPGGTTTVSGFLDISRFYTAPASQSDVLADAILTVSPEAGFSTVQVDGPGAADGGAGSWSFDLAGTER